MDVFTKAQRGCHSHDEYGQILSTVIERLSGQCVYGSQASLSWVFGYLSLICWFQAQFPQLILNLQRSSTEGVSPGFLASWMVGDMTNLLGCILTQQLPFQTLLATYYCFIDACLVCQYFFYNVVRRPSIVVIEGVENIGNPEPEMPKRAKWRFNPNSIVVLAMLVSGAAAETEAHENGKMRLIGLIAAWTSSLLYFTSRLPQIYKNYERKSTEGLSVLLFVAAFLGNLFYTISILSSPFAWPRYGVTEEESRSFLMGALPFLIGSAGTLCFDMTIVSQWYLYRPPSERRFFDFRISFQRIRQYRPQEREAAALLRDSMQNYGISSTR